MSESVEHPTVEVEVWGSEPAPGTGGGVESHLTSPIRGDVKTLETDNCQALDYRTSEMKNWKFSKNFHIFKQRPIPMINSWSSQQQGCKNSEKKKNNNNNNNNIPTLFLFK